MNNLHKSEIQVTKMTINVTKKEREKKLKFDFMLAL